MDEEYLDKTCTDIYRQLEKLRDKAKEKKESVEEGSIERAVYASYEVAYDDAMQVVKTCTSFRGGRIL